MKKPLNPWFEIGHDTATSHDGIDPIEWHYKRIGQNIKILKLNADINKIKKYAETFPDYQRDDVLTDISKQICHGEVREIFKQSEIKIRSGEKYTKREAAKAKGFKGIAGIDKLIKKGTLKRAGHRGNKVLLTGKSIKESKTKKK